MGRPPCCDKANVKKGPWTAEEDAKLLAYTSTHGTGNWTSVPQRAGLKRCGKSCRLRYTNYLRPNLKHENFTPEEEEHIVTLHAMLGSRWSLIANQLPGRTDNDVKNYWNTKLSKKLRQRGIDPITHRPIADLMQSIGSLAIRPPAAATAASSSHLTTTTTSFLPSTKPMLAPLLDPYTGPVVHDTSAPAAVASPELKWSDFLADGNDAALGSYGGGGVLQDVVFDQEGVVLGRGGGGGSGGGGVQGSGGGCDAGAGHDDPAAAAFIDAILECDKEMAADELISELLADPSYYCCSSSEMGWDC